MPSLPPRVRECQQRAVLALRALPSLILGTITRDQTNDLSRQGGSSAGSWGQGGAESPRLEGHPCALHTEPGTLSVSGALGAPGMEGESESLLT